VFKFDVAQSLDLARKLGVMATPTVILVAGGRIACVKLGAMTEKQLIELLG
jgi:thioredoxin-like negative regulator of GroEL